MKTAERTRTILRIWALASAVICLLCCAPLNTGGSTVFAEEDDNDWLRIVNMGNFDMMDSVGGNSITGLDVMKEDDISFMRIYLAPGGNDPFIYMPIGMIKEGIKCSEFKYMAIRLRTKAEGYGALYFGTSDDPGLNEEKNQGFANAYAGDGSWCTAVVDFSTHFRWTGYMTTARFDPYGSVPEGVEYIDIAWFAFVKTPSDLEKLDSALKDFETGMSVTRMPVFATPDRTRPAVSTDASVTGNAAQAQGRGLPGKLLAIGTAVLLALIFLAAVALVSKKRKT